MSSEQKDALMELCKVHVHTQVIIFYVPRLLASLQTGSQLCLGQDSGV